MTNRSAWRWDPQTSIPVKRKYRLVFYWFVFELCYPTMSFSCCRLCFVFWFWKVQFPTSMKGLNCPNWSNQRDFNDSCKLKLPTWYTQGKQSLVKGKHTALTILGNHGLSSTPAFDMGLKGGAPQLSEALWPNQVNKPKICQKKKRSGQTSNHYITTITSLPQVLPFWSLHSHMS